MSKTPQASPTEHQTLTQAVAHLNSLKRGKALEAAFIRLIRAGAVAVAAVTLWSLIRPGDQLGPLVFGLVVGAVTLAASMVRLPRHLVTEQDLALALEMKFGAGRRRPLGAAMPGSDVPDEWRDVLAQFIAELQAFERRQILALATTLVIPVALSLVSLTGAAPAFKFALSEVSSVVARLTRGATLRVVQGAATDLAAKADKPMSMSGAAPLELELLAQNLLEITVNGGGFGKLAPIVELRRAAPRAAFAAGKGATIDAKGGNNVEVFQSFQMSPRRDGANGEAGSDTNEEAAAYTISFAVSEPVELYIPALDGKRPMAHIKVRQLPIPQVFLSQTSEQEDPWPDDQPLGLHIDVSAENPLQTVRLLVKSGQRVSKELVANVMTEDKLKLSTDYRLLLESYVEDDLAEVEIVAEAIDRAVPTPLVGLSEPLRLKTASAYGRYRQSLATLREVKAHVDEALSKGNMKLPKEAAELARKAADQSEKSPFFDGLDRVQMHRFEAGFAALEQQPSFEKLTEQSQSLNEFLFEHEILDDRERDRDFFVATRAMSRLVEQEAARRPVALKTVTDRMQKFLDDRQVRWAKRLERLPAKYRPAKAEEIITQKPFHKAISQVETLDAAANAAGASPQTKSAATARSEQLGALSKAVVDYRAWIEELEAKEDKVREEQEQQRQEGLASARDTLRELQRRQAKVSADLDRAVERPKAQMEDQWPTTRMNQNANTKEARQLEGQMRSLSPTASERIQAAVKAMEQTAGAGNEGNFSAAEANADGASRLLHQAESAAQQSQQKRRSRGRRRRVTGDNYYGQSVVGGDVEIKREYQVDRRYREDILDEVQSTSYDEEDRALLEIYLRQVVR